MASQTEVKDKEAINISGALRGKSCNPSLEVEILLLAIFYVVIKETGFSFAWRMLTDRARAPRRGLDDLIRDPELSIRDDATLVG